MTPKVVKYTPTISYVRVLNLPTVCVGHLLAK